jgi:Mrp family chromosome partitioning ATPase
MMSREDVLTDLEQELDYMLVDAPEGLPQSALRTIKSEALAYAKRVLDSLSSAELHSETARERFMITTLRDAQRRMQRR